QTSGFWGYFWLGLVTDRGGGAQSILRGAATAREARRRTDATLLSSSARNKDTRNAQDLPNERVQSRAAPSGRRPPGNFSLSAIQNCPAVWPVIHIAGRISWSAASVQPIRGPAMTIASLKIESNATAREEV